MNIVVFASGGGSNFARLVKSQHEGAKFQIRLLFCDRPCGATEIAERAGIPVLYRSYLQHVEAMGSRERYDREVAEAILADTNERHYALDLVVLAGYMRLVTPPLLRILPAPVINLHPADLATTDSQGKRRYVGMHAIKTALLAGESRTRSTVIAVDEGVDTGPILGFGPWVAYQGSTEHTKEDIEAHIERHKQESDGPALLQVVNRLAEGETVEQLIRQQSCAAFSESSAMSR